MIGLPRKAVAFSPHENDLQALDRGILLATLSRGSHGSLGQNPETSQHSLTAVFLGCDRLFQTTTGNYTGEGGDGVNSRVSGSDVKSIGISLESQTLFIALRCVSPNYILKRI